MKNNLLDMERCIFVTHHDPKILPEEKKVKKINELRILKRAESWKVLNLSPNKRN